MVEPISFDNSWVLAAEGARRRMPLAAVAALALAGLAAGMIGGVAVYRALPSPLPGDEAAIALDRLELYLCTLAPMLAVVAASWAYERRAARNPRIGAPVAAAIGTLAGLGGFLTAVGIAATLGGIGPGGAAPTADHRIEGLVFGAGLIAFQATAEEVYFRSWLQPLLAERLGPWVGFCLTSVAFGLAHALTSPLGVVATCNDVLAGAVFGLLALRTGGLWAPAAAHWAWNWAEQSLLGLTPNPGVDPLGSLFDLDLKGPNLISGGVDEMNGSIAATVALAAIVLLLGLWRSSARQPQAVAVAAS